MNALARRGRPMAALGLVVALAGCGSSTAKAVKVVPPSPRKVVLASIRATEAAQSARVAMSVSASGAGAAGFVVTGDGITDLRGGNMQLTMRFQGPTAQMFEGGIEMRAVDGTAYMKLPGAIGGGKWMRVPLPDLGSQGAVPGAGSTDPAQFLKYLEATSSEVNVVGKSAVRGVETTQYHAVIDVQKALDQPDVPASLRDQLRQMMQSLDVAALPADVWVDGQGLLRRMRMQIGIGAISSTIIIEFYDFGVPVNVVAPPASEVIELPLGPSGAAA